VKYWAFISYSHTDKEWGDWLHKALETYHVPRRLIGRESRAGTIPARLFPIFRDREELPVSADLSSNINEALQGSRYLIVVCSPHSAQSRWVAEEIKQFKTLHREECVLALIVAGEPNASDGKPGFQSADECFPESMRYRIGTDGELSSTRTEPIAADAREGKDGRENAKLKLLAGLLGVDYDELRQRDHERRLRRARVIGAAALVLMGIFAGLASWAIMAAKQASAQKRQTQRLLVASDMARADELFAKDDAASAICFLARATEQEPDEYSAAAERLWFALTERSWPLPISAPMDHVNSVLSATFSPDGEKIVTASRDSTARIWDTSSGSPIGAVMTHPRLVRRALFTPDGQYIFTICFDGVGRLWNSSSGQAVPHWSIKHSDSINSAALSPSGKLIATGSSDGVVHISDSATAQQLGEVHQDENVHTLLFHPTDDTLLLSVSGSVARLWKLPEGAALFEMRHGAQVNSAQFDPLGNRIVTASSDRTVRIWDIATGKITGEAIEHEGEVRNAILSSDGKLMATLVGSRLLLWEIAEKPKLKFTFEHTERVACARFTPDDLVIVSGTDGGRVQGRNVNNGDTVGEPIREDGAIVAIDFNREGTRWLIATGKGEARTWQPPPRYPISNRFVHGGAVESMNLSSNGRWLATGAGDGKARLWDLTASDTAKELPHSTTVLCTAFDGDGRYLLTGAADGKARLWETSSGKEVGLPLSHGPTVSKVIFDFGGKFFVTASEDGSAQSWNLASRKSMGKPMVHGSPITSLDLNSDATLVLTTGSDKKVRLWHSQTGEPVGSTLEAETEVTCARFSPKGTLIAAGSRDGTVYLWLVASGKLLGQFRQKGSITDCAFSPDGRYVASASEDHTAVIWEISSGKFVGDSLRHASVVSALVFAADSSKIATASEDGVVRLWQVISGRAITEPLRHEKAVRLLAFGRDGDVLFSGSRDRLVKMWDITTHVTPADRSWLTSFARSVSPSRLTEAGRIEHRVVDSREALRAKLTSSSRPASALREWFFAEPRRRQLTPYSRRTLLDYLTTAKSMGSTAEEEKFYLPDSH
jgi:WD40 repeat protein